MKPWIWIASLAACAACSTSDTRIHLEVAGDSSGLDHYQLLVGSRAALTAPLSALDVVVPDDMAGQASSLELWGLVGGQQVAYGSTTVTPSLHSTITTQVTLAAVSCGTWCTIGDVECSDDGVITCAMQSNGCVGWSAPVACPGATPFCSNGACAAQCTDECSTGQTMCDSSSTVRTCGQFDSDPCLDWSPPMACGSGTTCTNGACSTTTTCTDGESCDDGNACTDGDICDSGVCSGTPKCTAPANADPTCATDGTCGFACHPGYQQSGSTCVAVSKLVFVTSARSTGNFGGLVGADAFCQNAANTAGKPGTFKAWLSDNQTSAASRMTHSPGPYVEVNSEAEQFIVAADWAGLTSGTLMEPIDADENGHAPTASVWTNTKPDGSIYETTTTCIGWQSSADTDWAGYGSPFAVTDATWTEKGTGICSSQCSLYCIEQ